MTRRLPPGIVRHQYKTAGGYKKTLFYPRFTCWDGRRRTFTPGWEELDEALDELGRLKKLNRGKSDFDNLAPAPPAPTLKAWMAKLAAISAGKPIGVRHGYSMKKLAAFFGDDCLLVDVTHSRMQEYRAERRGDGVMDSTINREMACLRSTLLLAHYDKQLEEMPEIPFEPEENERVRTATPGEYRRILKALGPDERDFAEIIREMGFRLKDVGAITAADLIPATRSIDMRRIRSKRGNKRPLPLSRRAWAILSRRAKGRSPKQRLFPFTRSRIRWAFTRACARLGIHDLWLYDLKATFVTEKLRQGWQEKIVMEYTGNKTPGTFKRYERPTDEDLRSFIGVKRSRIGNGRFRRIPENRPSS